MYWASVKLKLEWMVSAADLVCHTVTDLRSKEAVVKALRTSLASKQVRERERERKREREREGEREREREREKERVRGRGRVRGGVRVEIAPLTEVASEVCC